VPTVEETRSQLDTLLHARCNLVGTVLNREPTSFLRKHLSKWVHRFSLLLLTSLLGFQDQATIAVANAAAAEPTPALGSFSVGAPARRAAWQERLTLGPGDTFDLSVFGYPDAARTNIVVGPDGRINFLQLQDFPASGFTIDELRSKLDAALDPTFPGARTIIIPTAFNSKKYFVLGKVVMEGVFLLDRPLTIIEAVARAKGLQTSTVGRGTTDIADLARSFLVRQGKRVPIDLERLFHAGDLSQNIPLEPNDYLYFAGGAPHEIYVLGEVFSPGIINTTTETSLMAVLSARGGFTEKAYRKRVLVVRGSLQHPEAFAVDTPAILAGRTPDFKLQPRDIVYVNARPWLRVEQLLDLAAQSFIEAAVTFWAGRYVPTVFTTPIFPGP